MAREKKVVGLIDIAVATGLKKQFGSRLYRALTWVQTWQEAEFLKKLALREDTLARYETDPKNDRNRGFTIWLWKAGV